MKMIKSSFAIAVGFSIASGYAIARPATSSDFAGRTICYDNSMKATYFKNGKYTNSMFGQGTWRVDSGGIHIKTSTIDEVLPADIQPDSSVWLSTVKLRGKDCK